MFASDPMISLQTHHVSIVFANALGGRACDDSKAWEHCVCKCGGCPAPPPNPPALFFFFFFFFLIKGCDDIFANAVWEHCVCK